MKSIRGFSANGKITVNVVCVIAGNQFRPADIEQTKNFIEQELAQAFARQEPRKKHKKTGFALRPERKYLDLSEIRKLLRTVEEQKELALMKQEYAPIWRWFFLQTALNTGLRVGEIANLRCGDGHTKSRAFMVNVRSGKGEKPGRVICSKAFQRAWGWFLDWKKQNGHSIDSDAPLFLSPRTGRALTVRAFQKAFKRMLAHAGLGLEYSPHSLRHSYGTHLHQSCKDIRVVQSQLRHESVRTTQVYASVIPDEIVKAVERFSTLLGADSGGREWFQTSEP